MNDRRQTAGFTLIELLLVIGIIGILAGLVMPSVGRSMRQAKRIQCATNLRQIGIAFQQFADLNQNRYPMHLPETRSGTSTQTAAAEFLVLAASPFQDVARELASPRLLVCAADVSRTPAETFATLTDNHISYVVATVARPGDATTMVATDRNVVTSRLDNEQRGSGGRIAYGTDFHDRRGNVLMGDGRVEWVGGIEWTQPPAIVPPTNHVTVLAPVVEDKPIKDAVPRTAPDSSVSQFDRAPAVTATNRSALPPPKITETDTNTVEQPLPEPREPPLVFSLVPAGDGSPPANRNWWWLLLLLAAVAFWLLRSRGGRDPSIGRMTVFYTGAAVNADAMLATLEENDIATRWEYVHAKRRDNDDENTRPMRIYVDKEDVERANELFSGDQRE